MELNVTKDVDGAIAVWAFPVCQDGKLVHFNLFNYPAQLVNKFKSNSVQRQVKELLQ